MVVAAHSPVGVLHQKLLEDKTTQWTRNQCTYIVRSVFSSLSGTALLYGWIPAPPFPLITLKRFCLWLTAAVQDFLLLIFLRTLEPPTHSTSDHETFFPILIQMHFYRLSFPLMPCVVVLFLALVHLKWAETSVFRHNRGDVFRLLWSEFDCTLTSPQTNQTFRAIKPELS